MQVVHLSCHGTNDKRVTEKAPALFLEDELGHEHPVSAGDLAHALAAKPPRLLFLSACLTAAGDADSPDPLVSALVASGFSACLGWAGSVLDPEATRFAAELYQPLADGVALEQAVARATRTLLLSNPPSPDWHLARLWLGADGGGPLVGAPLKERRIVTASAGYKEMLDKRAGKSPVASREEFVGRRRELKEALRVLERGDYAGILIHGLGRLGKSSLAARIANRVEHRLRRAVLYKQYDAGTLIEELRAASPLAAAWLADNPVDPADPVRLELALRALFEGPLGVAGYKALRVIPYCSSSTTWSACWRIPGRNSDPETVLPDHRPMLRALLRGLDPARTASRLLITSRYRFRLPDGRDDLAHKLLYNLQPRPMHNAALAKMAHRAAPAGEAALRDRAVEASIGNPGLLAILATAIANEPDAVPGLLAEMEAHLAKGAHPSDPRLTGFLTDLVLDRLVAMLDPHDQALLRALRLFDLPVPVDILRLLEGSSGAIGGRLDRLFSLGLLNRGDDLVSADVPAAIFRLSLFGHAPISLPSSPPKRRPPLPPSWSIRCSVPGAAVVGNRDRIVVIFNCSTSHWPREMPQLRRRAPPTLSADLTEASIHRPQLGRPRKRLSC